MSTTLSVLHVLMAGPGRDVNLPAGARDVIMGGGGGAGLDPLLQDFWSAFPCPPPWNHNLLFRVNWTACVGQAVGERLKWFLADRCNIPHDGLLPGGEGGTGEEEEMEVPEVCSLPCIIMIALAGLLLSLLIAALVFCVCRKRPKSSSPTHQSALNAHPDNAKYYTSCHYASAPVMPRPLETALCGNRTETRVMNGTCSHQLSPYHHPLLSTCHHHHHHHPQHPAPVVVNAQGHSSLLRHKGEQLPLVLQREPMLLKGEPTATGSGTDSVLSYRRLDAGGDYSCSSVASHSNSERSHTYESIGEGGHWPLGVPQPVGVTGPPSHRATPELCDCDCPSHLHLHLPAHLDGYYSDRSTQTLPVRPHRHVTREAESMAGPYSFDIQDAGGEGSGGQRSDSRLSQRSRRRTSSGSHYSDRSGSAGRDGHCYRRHIPALHPNYFDPPEPPAPDPVTS